MNREGYLNQLRLRNSMCGCSSLDSLYRTKLEAISLERERDSLARGLDLEKLDNNNLLSLHNYRDKCEEFQEAVKEYHSKIQELIEEGDLKVFCHNLEERTITGIENLKRLDKDKLFTIHCVSCDQQVDILIPSN